MSASEFFTVLGAVVKSEGAGLVAEVGSVFKFQLDGQSWTIDLKNGSGSVGKTGPSPDCTFIMTEADFVKMIAKEVDSTALFMEGRMKFEGDMGTAMKFGSVLEELEDKLKAAQASASPSQAQAPSSSSGSGSEAAPFMQQLGGVLSQHGASIVSKVGAVFQYNFSTASGSTDTWTIDLKNGSGSVYAGPAKATADVTFGMLDTDFVKMLQKEANPQMLFMEGKLTMDGDLGLAMKFQAVLEELEETVGPAASQSTSAATANTSTASSSINSQFKSAKMFSQIEALMSSPAGEAAASDAPAVFHFKVTGNGKVAEWVLDTKSRRVYEGAPKGPADLTFQIADEDFVELALKEANPQMMFMEGKLKLEGDMGLAMKFGSVLEAFDLRRTVSKL